MTRSGRVIEPDKRKGSIKIQQVFVVHLILSVSLSLHFVPRQLFFFCLISLPPFPVLHRVWMDLFTLNGQIGNQIPKSWLPHLSVSRSLSMYLLTPHSLLQELILTPDFTWTRIPKCTSGRVFLLACPSASRELFFWLQEPTEERDQEIADKVSEYIANPPQGGAGGAGGLDLSSLLALSGGAGGSGFGGGF